MSNELIQKEYNQNLKSLVYYNQRYYNGNISEISDFAYDELKNEILNLEKKYKFLKSKDSPSIKVGFKPS